MKKTDKLCVRIGTEVRYGDAYVFARVFVRREGDSFPMGAPLYVQDDKFFDGLVLEGFISDFSGAFLMHSPAYVGVNRFTGDKLTAAAKVITRVEKRINKDNAYEAGDVFRSFLLALGIKDVCMQVVIPGEVYDWHRGWRWLSAEQGRVEFRRMADAAVEQWNMANPEKAAKHAAKETA